MLLVDDLGERSVAYIHPRLPLWRRGAARRADPGAVHKLDVLLEDPHVNLNR